MKRAAVLVVFALLSLQPAPHADAGDRVTVVRVATGRRAPSEREARAADSVTEILPRRTEPAEDPGASVERAGPAQTTAVGVSAPTLGVNVRGFTFTGVLPPDPAGEAGATQYVHTANTARGAEVGVFDKTTGTRVKSFHMDRLAPFNDACRRGLGDGVPLWDELDSRWILTEIASRGNNLCVYVSDGPDAATAMYTLYRVHFPFFPDYPKWGIWPGVLYVGVNHGPRRNPIVALNLLKMIASQPLVKDKDVNLKLVHGMRGFGFEILVPVDLDGATPPPPNAPGIFVRHVDDEVNRRKGHRDPSHDFIEYFEMTPDFLTGVASVAGPFDVPVAPFNSRLCGLFTLRCVPQRGTTMKLDALREPMMNRPVMRVIGASQTLVGSFTVNVGRNRAGIRWFELSRPAATTSGGWALADEGTYAPAGRHRWVPSIAINNAGDIALGYSASSRKSFPSIRITGRLAGDPSGLMKQDETLIKGSDGPQTFAPRWGDYTEMSVDPSDNTTFWYTSEYLNRRGEWRTRIASFSLGP